MLDHAQTQYVIIKLPLRVSRTVDNLHSNSILKLPTRYRLKLSYQWDHGENENQFENNMFMWI